MPKKVGFTQVQVQIADSLFQRVQNALWWTPGRLTLTALVRAGLLAQVEALEAEHNKGRPFRNPPEE